MRRTASIVGLSLVHAGLAGELFLMSFLEKLARFDKSADPGPIEGAFQRVGSATGEILLWPLFAPIAKFAPAVRWGGTGELSNVVGYGIFAANSLIWGIALYGLGTWLRRHYR